MWERNTHKHGPVRTPEVQREQRYIFNGDRKAEVAGYALRQNRRTVRRKLSTFNVIVGLFIFGTLIVLYIHNIITINQLVVDVNTLQGRYQRQVESNAALLAEVNRKASLERIGKLASESLGMQYAQEQQQWFNTPDDIASRAAKIRKELGE
jgi:cell division protein FtsL